MNISLFNGGNRYILELYVELFVKIFVPSVYQKITLKYMRVICFLFMFLFSGVIREFRETQLKKKEQIQVQKQTVEDKKNQWNNKYF